MVELGVNLPKHMYLVTLMRNIKDDEITLAHNPTSFFFL